MTQIRQFGWTMRRFEMSRIGIVYKSVQGGHMLEFKPRYLDKRNEYNRKSKYIYLRAILL